MVFNSYIIVNGRLTNKLIYIQNPLACVEPVCWRIAKKIIKVAKIRSISRAPKFIGVFDGGSSSR